VIRWSGSVRQLGTLRGRPARVGWHWRLVPQLSG